MKKSPCKIASVILALLFLTPFFWCQINSVASAATPSFKEKSVEIVGEGETYKLEILNKESGNTYKWSSSNTKVAKVSSKGIITTKTKGKTNIKCKITYSSGKSKTITCKVSVIIPATGLKINNANEVNGAHILKINERYNFNRDIVPSNSSDKTYWSIGGGDKDCIEIVKDDSGIVEAKKVGKVILVATVAKTATKEDASKSIINDAIIIEVVELTSTVTSAEITDSTEIKVVFDSPIDKNTVIGEDDKLLDSIEISMRENLKGVLSNDPGELKGSLSQDKKTLTITSKDMFNGDYIISFTDKIKTVDGISIKEYYKRLSFIDTIPPFISEVKLDSTGMIVALIFNEAVDFTNFKVSNAMVLPSANYSSTVDNITLSILNNRINYIISEDKKSVTVNLSKIAITDFNKNFSVIFSGIMDLSGNIPANYTMTAVLFTDTTPKPQARPVLPILRTGYNTVTVTFDRAIQYAGRATLSNGSICYGVVDSNDNTKVNYTLSDYDAKLTGLQSISIGYWNSYNVDTNDRYANKVHKFDNVNFSVDKSSPMLLGYEYNADTAILTLKYNKDVTLVSNNSVFNASVVTVTDEIRPGYGITYTELPSMDKRELKLSLGNITLLGVYTFSLDKGFVMDDFRNPSLSRAITISNTDGEKGELPGPYAIIQSDTNPSYIYLEFANMLDKASAEIVTNYSIPGVTIVSAKVVKNTKDSGATVELTVAEGSIDVTLERPFIISGVKGHGGTYAAIDSYQTTIDLRDNMKPYYIGPATYDSNSLAIKLNFSEAIEGDLIARITQIGNNQIEYPNTVTVSGNSVYLTLGMLPQNNTYLKIEILHNGIKDLSGNQSRAMESVIGVVVNY